MSAPDTNTEKQQDRHRAPLGGMALAVIFAVVLLIGLVMFLILGGDDPEGADTQIDGRTGAVEAPVTTDSAATGN